MNSQLESPSINYKYSYPYTPYTYNKYFCLSPCHLAVTIEEWHISSNIKLVLIWTSNESINILEIIIVNCRLFESNVSIITILLHGIVYDIYTF